MTTLVGQLLPDELWRLVEPLLPRPAPLVGRPASCHPRPQLLRRDRLHGPHLHSVRLLAARELGCGSPATGWRRLDEWAKAGVFDRLHLDVLDRLGEQGRLDWTRASVDSASMRAKRGGTTLAQIRSIVASPGRSSTWSATGAGCR
jgi:transposase